MVTCWEAGAVAARQGGLGLEAAEVHRLGDAEAALAVELDHQIDRRLEAAEEQASPLPVRPVRSRWVCILPLTTRSSGPGLPGTVQVEVDHLVGDSAVDRPDRLPGRVSRAGDVDLLDWEAQLDIHVEADAFVARRVLFRIGHDAAADGARALARVVRQPVLVEGETGRADVDPQLLAALALDLTALAVELELAVGPQQDVLDLSFGRKSSRRPGSTPGRT